MSHSFPRTMEALTLDWFNGVTQAQLGARATRVDVRPLSEAGEGFYGAHAKVTAHYAESQPREMVAKFSPLDDQARSAVDSINAFEREVNFYLHLADKSPVSVPRCFFAAYDGSEGQSLLLLDCIDGVPGSYVAGASLPQAREAMRTAATLHRYWQGDPILNEPWLDKLTDARFTGAMADAASGAIALAQEKLPGIVSDWILEAAPNAPGIIVAQAAALAEHPDTLIHFDYHVSNLMFRGDDVRDPTLLDWQFAVCGPGVWDAAVFCIMSLPVEDRRAWAEELGLGYLSELRGKAVDRWPPWLEDVFGRVGLSFVAHLIRNVTVFDFDDPQVVAVVREFFLRAGAAAEDYGALRLLD